MRECSLVPTNLLTNPRCDSLLPEQKLILIWLWASPYLSCAGAGHLPLKASAATLGLSSEALAGGLSDLQRLKLISFDLLTGELFICDWFRYHKFNSPVSKTMLVNAIKKIESETLKKEISIKSAGCFPTSTSTSTSTNPLKANTPSPPDPPGEKKPKPNSLEKIGTTVGDRIAPSDESKDEECQYELTQEDLDHIRKLEAERINLKYKKLNAYLDKKIERIR